MNNHGENTILSRNSRYDGIKWFVNTPLCANKVIYKFNCVKLTNPKLKRSTSLGEKPEKGLVTCSKITDDFEH